MGWETAREKLSVWVFERRRGDPDRWRQVAVLREPRPVGETSGLGSAAISGDVLVAGATSDDETGLSAGAAYVFEPTGDSTIHPWRWVTLLAPDGGNNYAYFGTRPDIEGDTIAIGAPQDGERGAHAGAVWVFEKQSDGRWEPVVKLMGSDIGPSEQFGGDLALHGDTIAVVSSPSGQAVVYLFDRDAGGPDRWGKNVVTAVRDAGR